MDKSITPSHLGGTPGSIYSKTPSMVVLAILEPTNMMMIFSGSASYPTIITAITITFDDGGGLLQFLLFLHLFFHHRFLLLFSCSVLFSCLPYLEVD
jgi:hypothetical protein